MSTDSASAACADKLFMVKPALFGFNLQTAGTNVFQNQTPGHNDIHQKAVREFMDVAEKLDSKGMEVVVFESSDKEAPDSVFPNNWFSTHRGGRLVLYPMYAPNRRRERDSRAIELIRNSCQISHTIDFAGFESENRFLEGTGSIIFDHGTANAYAAIGPRTDKALFDSLCRELGCNPISFRCEDPKGNAFYHTNVILHMGNDHAVLYEAGINDEKERRRVMDSLRQSKKDIVSISMDQVMAFCGNMLQVQNAKGDLFLLCTETSLKAFSASQKKLLERHSGIIPFHIPTIEHIGGGSIRCMIAELY